MLEKVNQLKEEIEQLKATSAEQAEALRIKYLGQKGIVKTLFQEFKEVDKEVKKQVGAPLNQLKNQIQEKINALKLSFENQLSKAENTEDLTKPALELPSGSQHPISIVRNQIQQIFTCMGFSISEGPELEDDWHNFTALNFPPEHPARDMQDTFFIKDKPEYSLRTHTSSVQVRVMQNNTPPMRTISPGRVFRNEAISARSHCFFHQVEGLYIDKHVSFADLKKTMLDFAQQMFGKDTQIRLRPSYFPFTEPSAEMDISCFICDQKGCNICKHSGWVEILGCGMIDPNVLKNCGIDSEKYSGYAFGMGIERITMLKYQINDIRLFYENDTRFLSQFTSA